MKRINAMSALRSRIVTPARALLVALAASSAAAFACGPSADTLGSGRGFGQGAPDGGDDGSTTTAPVIPASLDSRRIRRLTREEYANTLKDLLGTPTDYGATLPADQVVNGFDGNSDVLEVGSLLADQLRQNAETIADAFDLGSIGCPASQGEACARTFAQTFGQRALRRPLKQDEVDRYAALFQVGAANGGFEVGIRTIVQGMLQSPSFLYRTELGTHTSDGFALTPWEVASELSYLFWRTMPDAELTQHATSGDLLQPDVVAAEAARLLASPRANAMLDGFVDEWLEVDRIAQSPKDAATYPSFTPAVLGDMIGETHAFFENVARDPQGTFATLLTADYSYVTPSLAQFYGLTSPPNGQGLVKTNVAPDRGGLLTLGSILTTEATPTAANPVRRGKLVRVRMLCQDVPPPPPGLNAKIPPLDPKAPNRQKFAAHESNPSCSGCHQLLDPIGFGFERFDGVGRVLSGTIDTTGAIKGSASSDTTFDGVRDLEQKLAASDDARTCFVRQWVRSALGVSDTDSSGAEITRLASATKASGTSVQALLRAMAAAPYMTKRKDEVIPPP
jgi:hypothetical protein